MSLGARNITQRITVNTDAAVTLDGDGYSIPWPVNLTVLPGSGGTILVEWQTAQGGSWTAWPQGTVSAKTVGRGDWIQPPKRALTRALTTDIST